MKTGDIQSNSFYKLNKTGADAMRVMHLDHIYKEGVIAKTGIIMATSVWFRLGNTPLIERCLEIPKFASYFDVYVPVYVPLKGVLEPPDDTETISFINSLRNKKTARSS